MHGHRSLICVSLTISAIVFLQNFGLGSRWLSKRGDRIQSDFGLRVHRIRRIVSKLVLRILPSTRKISYPCFGSTI
jgi:hypothetical protein